MQEETAATAPQAAAEAFELPAWTPEAVRTVWGYVESYPFLAAFGIVIVFYLIAKLSEIIICRGISRLTERTETEVDDQLIAFLRRPVFITLFFCGLAVAVRVLALPAAIALGTINVLQTLVALVWLVAGTRISRLLLAALGRNQERFPIIEERTIPLFDITAKLLLIGGVSYAVLMIWGIDPTAWLASAGVIGIAIGFAAKDTLANLFAGFFIVADAPYKLGDFIILDSGERGRVTHVGIRSTRLLTRDDIEVTLPNAVIANSKIINESGGPWEKERVRIKVGVAYGSDLDQVCAVLERVAIGHEHICVDPAPRVRFRQFGDSSLDLELLCWIDEPVLRGRLTHELNMEVYKAFNRDSIEIPFPQRDLHVKAMPVPEQGS